MNYGNDNLGGVWSSLLSLGKAGYAYGTTYYDVRKQQADLALENAVDTSVARQLATEYTYAANRAAAQEDIDKEKQKRYLITGAAIGIPVLLGLILIRKGR